MRFLILFGLIGSNCALQYPVEYTYHYEGRIASGIPSIRAQVAALGIRAKLTLQMKEENLAIAKLTDVEVGEFNDDLQCVQLRQPVPFTYQPMPEPHKKLLEQPFAVYFHEDSGHVMDVHESDVEFITNIRKSVVEMLRIEPIMANFGGIKGDRLSKHYSADPGAAAFTVEEDSIFGRCESEYSITPLPPSYPLEEKDAIAKHLKKDEQSKSSPRSSTSNLPKLEEQCYRLVRAINFDKCHDLVIQQHAGGANMSDAGSSQFRAVQSRSSVATYIIKGRPGAFRVELATVEGDVVVNPFGFKTERLQAITNQTLVLESAQPVQMLLILPVNLKAVKTWRFEVASPFSPAEAHQKEWVNHYNKNDKYYPVSMLWALGAPLSDQHLKEIEEILLHLLDITVIELYAEPSLPSIKNPSPEMTKTSSATTYLHIMTKIIRYLPINSVKEVFSQIFRQNDIHSQRKQILLIDVAAASGAPAPMKVLLEMMKRNEISHHRIASIFFTIPNNLFAPTLIPELLEYVKSLDIESNPLLTSSALINFASLAERACINHRKFNYSLPFAIFGNENCDPAIIVEDFLPYLVEKAKTASKSYERIIYIQAIINLGSREIVEVLKPFIRGEIDPSPQVRTVAIHGLSSLRLPHSVREQVFDTLMAVVDNLEERPDIRQAALSMLITWHPSASWWQRMARSTWREPSNSLAAFIATIVQSLAKATEPSLRRQSRIAAFVLPLLKPFYPSLRSSYGGIYSRFDPESKIGFKYDFSLTESPTDWAPSEIYTSLRENFGDLFIHLFEVSLTTENMEKSLSQLLGVWRALSEGKLSSSSFNAKIPSERRPIPSQRWSSDGKKAEANIYLRTFENLYQLLPINAEVLSKLAGGKEPEAIIKKFLSGVEVTATKFLDPLNLEFFLPTEIGLPLTGEVSMPTINLGEVDVRLDTPGLPNPTLSDLFKHNRSSLLFKSKYKYASKLIVKLTAIAPWSLKVFEAGVENYDELNLPFYANLSLARSEEVKNFSLNLSPYTQQKFPLLHQHNVPFTLVRNIVPSKDLKTDYKVIAIEKDRKPALEVRKEFDPRYTGLTSGLDYSGDAPYPFTSEFLWDYLRKPVLQGKLLASPVAKQWQYSLTLDPKSESRNVTLALSFVTTSMFHRLESEAASGTDFSANDDEHERLIKMRKLAPETLIYGMNAQLFFNGTYFRRYEFVKTSGRITVINSVIPWKRLIVTALLMSEIPGVTDSPQALCADTTVAFPIISDLYLLKHKIRSNPEGHLTSSVQYGSSCETSEIATVKATFKLSNERQSLLSDELEKISNYDPRDPAVELQTAAVYDIGILDIKFAKEKIPRALLNASYSLQQFVEGAVFPHGSYNKMYSGPPDKIRVEARRPLWSEKYTFHVEAPQKYSIFSEIHVPYLATRIFPFNVLPFTIIKSTDSNLISTTIPYICEFYKTTIKTFDSVNYQYHPVEGTTSCWALALKDNRGDHPEFLVRARYNTRGLPEAQVKNGDGTIHVEVTYEKAFINGAEMPASSDNTTIFDPSGNLVAVVNRLNKGFYVNWTNTFNVVVTSDFVRIIPTVNIEESVRGLCGDFDGNKKYDKTGPKNCLYTDDTLFKYSWTSPEGDGCDQRQEQKMQRRVKSFQNHNCQERPTVTDWLSTGSHSARCKEKVYPVKKENDLWCATYRHVHICKQDCVLVTSQKVKKKCGCWPEYDVPDDVKEGEERGYIYNKPKERAPIYGLYMTVDDATKCQKK